MWQDGVDSVQSSSPATTGGRGGEQRKDKAQGGKRAINPNQSCCFFILFFFPPVPSLFLPLLLLLCCISICTSVPQLGNTFPDHPLPFFALFPPWLFFPPRSNQNRTLSFLVKMSHPSPRILLPLFIEETWTQTEPNLSSFRRTLPVTRLKLVSIYHTSDGVASRGLHHFFSVLIKNFQWW